MPRLTIFFGIVLILLGVLTFMDVGSRFPTSLIPAILGIVLAVCGFLARTTDTKRRALFMHIAVTVGLLGFLATIKGAFQYIKMLQGTQYQYPIAVEEKTAMCVLLLVFVILCVRSFIAARKARIA
jgi:uncharacterized membrane protein HdeD (DUF308 family)